MESRKNWKQVLLMLYSGQFFSLLSSAAVQFSIIWWLTDTTGSPLVLAMAGIAGFLPQALLGPVAGAFVDRYSRKTMMIAADMTVALGSIALFAAMSFGEPSIALVIIVLMVRSLATAFHMPAMQASVPLLAPEEHLTKASGWGQMVSSITNVAGPAVGMALLAASSIQWVLLLDVLGAVIASGVLLFIHIPKPAAAGEQAEDRAGLIAEMKEGYQAIAKHRLLWKLTMLMTAIAVLFIPIGTYFPLMVRNHFGKGVVEAGVVETVFAIGLIAGASLVGVLGDRLDKIKTMAAGMALMGIALCLSGLLPSSGYYAFVVMSALIGISGPLFSAPFYAYVQTEIEPHLLGRVFSFITSLSLLATPIGMGLAGAVTELTSVAFLFSAAGLLVILNAALTLKVKK
ncbi:MFS transporter [Paenibacillus sp. IB182493]|uniref:MFS transporter n=2 Tax=Paenibacillus arenilitoris TaxID=2772299 RepID=A0A927H587_9BACL|nr:MFS transporter [Paenibacillus arenilitoris]